MITKLITILLFNYIFVSYSARSPKLIKHPNDYELACGMRSDYYDWKLERERENGGYYNGGRLHLSTKYIETDIIVNEAKQIDYESIKALVQPFKGYDKLKVGFSLTANSWSDCKPCIAIRFKDKATYISYETDFQERTATSIKIGLEIPFKEHFIINPYTKLIRANNSEYWQDKIEIGYKR